VYFRAEETKFTPYACRYNYTVTVTAEAVAEFLAEIPFLRTSDLSLKLID
jgi:hypothetical protein